MLMRRLVVIVLAILLCEAVGFVGSIFTAKSVNTWYATLQKPSFSPPNWIFAPVWAVLYALMGIAAALILFRGWNLSSVRTALILFLVQLVFNAAWSAIFFGLRAPGPAFFELIALWILVFVTLWCFVRISIPAGVLLVPYLLWTTFAAVLNYSIWRIN